MFSLLLQPAHFFFHLSQSHALKSTVIYSLTITQFSVTGSVLQRPRSLFYIPGSLSGRAGNISKDHSCPTEVLMVKLNVQSVSLFGSQCTEVLRFFNLKTRVPSAQNKRKAASALPLVITDGRHPAELEPYFSESGRPIS